MPRAVELIEQFFELLVADQIIAGTRRGLLRGVLRTLTGLLCGFDFRGRSLRLDGFCGHGRGRGGRLRSSLGRGSDRLGRGDRLGGRLRRGQQGLELRKQGRIGLRRGPSLV